MSSRYPVLENRPIDQWKVTELKEELRRRKLTTKGLKEDLVKRLFESIQSETESHEKAGLDNGTKLDYLPQELHDDDGQVAASENIQPEKDYLESIEPESNTQRDYDQSKAVEQSIHLDVDMVDQVNDQNHPDVNTVDQVNDQNHPDVNTVDQVNDQNHPDVNTVDQVNDQNHPDVNMVDQINDQNHPDVNTVDQVNDQNHPNVNMVDQVKDQNHLDVNTVDQVNVRNHPDVNVIDQVNIQDQIDDKASKALDLEENKADSDVPNVKQGSADVAQKMEDPPIELANTDDSEEKASENEHPFQSETTVKNVHLDQKEENQQFPKGGTLDSFQQENQVSEVKENQCNSSSPINLNTENLESVQNEPESNREPPSEDAKLEQVQQENQVSEVKPNFGFQISSELISSDSVSINKKNELKDNLNANDFPLEVEVSKPEMLHSSSADVAPVDGELQPLDTAHEPGVGLGPSEEVDVAMTAKDENIEKKIESADASYPEKLNLDRSSGEESMEEDVVESKQVPNEGGEKGLVRELHGEGSHLDGKASMILEDIPMESSLPITNAEKRKPEGSDTARVGEPSKRQRRWNSEPLKVPDHPPSILTASTPSASIHPTPKRSLIRSDSSVSSRDSPKERVVPPSQKSPTTSLRIDRFLRPFTLKQVHELLGKTGNVCSFWMDNIKTHCYVTYLSEEEAVATRSAVYNLQWPPNGGRLLVAEFVDPQEVKLRAEAPPESPVPITPSPKTPSAPPQNHAPQPPVRQHGPKQQLPPPPPLPSPPTAALADPPIVRERQQLPPAPRKRPEPPKPEPPVLTLDDLFMKTKATPRIYYLPLPEDKVAAKRAKMT